MWSSDIMMVRETTKYNIQTTILMVKIERQDHHIQDILDDEVDYLVDCCIWWVGVTQLEVLVEAVLEEFLEIFWGKGVVGVEANTHDFNPCRRFYKYKEWLISDSTSKCHYYLAGLGEERTITIVT